MSSVFASLLNTGGVNGESQQPLMGAENLSIQTSKKCTTVCICFHYRVGAQIQNNHIKNDQLFDQSREMEGGKEMQKQECIRTVQEKQTKTILLVDYSRSWGNQKMIKVLDQLL